VIDADASPSGYVAWYNHYTDVPKIRVVRPARRNERFGVQRMEMLAVYSALSDNLTEIRKVARLEKRVAIAVRSDSKSTVEQLLGRSTIRDSLMRRISAVIGKLLASIKCTITFDHLERSHNIAGLLIEQKRRKERELDIEQRPVLVRASATLAHPVAL
jgi:ribonuclease HI